MGATRVGFLSAVLGAGMGAIIHFFEIQPFIVTLAGMFLARGLCYTIGTDSIPIEDPTFTAFAQTRIDCGPVGDSAPVVLDRSPFDGPGCSITTCILVEGGSCRRHSSMPSEVRRAGDAASAR